MYIIYMAPKSTNESSVQYSTEPAWGIKTVAIYTSAKRKVTKKNYKQTTISKEGLDWVLVCEEGWRQPMMRKISQTGLDHEWQSEEIQGTTVHPLQ